MTQCDPSPIFTRTLGTAATFIAPTWRGRYTLRAEAFRNNKSETKYCMLAISLLDLCGADYEAKRWSANY